MLERFGGDAKRAAAGAREEARALGSATVEAEHLLLALCRQPVGAAAEALAECGLDHDAAGAALEAETERSLAAVGVALGGGLPRPLAAVGQPRWGASAKLSLERALEAARERGDRRLEAAHVLLGVLAARAGTVPRALAGAGVEPAELAARTEAALGRGR